MEHPGDWEEEALILLALCEDERFLDCFCPRERVGEFTTLYPELRRDETKFFEYFKMCSQCFDNIYEMIHLDIEKQRCKDPIIGEERLALALSYLVTGDSYSTLGYRYDVGYSTVSKIIEEVFQAIWENLQPIYMPSPNQEIWENSMEGFYAKYKYPNCMGCIDGKHVPLKRKKTLILLAIVGPDSKFLKIDVGDYDQYDDAQIFTESKLGKEITNREFKLTLRKLPDQPDLIPCVFLGDISLVMTPHIMRPYAECQAQKDKRKRTFNVKMRRTRKVVKNAYKSFGSKWRIFQKPLETNMNNSINIVQTACVLHNFLLDMGKIHSHHKTVQSLDPAFKELHPSRRRSTRYAMHVRELFTDHFCRQKVEVKVGVLP